MKKLSFNTQLILALVGSVLFATLYAWTGLCYQRMEDWLNIIGDTFISALQLLAVPLVFCSIVVGINSTRNTAQLARVGIFTTIVYVLTTIFAVSLGLLIGNIVRPGHIFNRLGGLEGFNQTAAGNILEGSPKIPVDSTTTYSLIPNNFFALFQHNGNLVWIVVFAVLFGIALGRIPPKRKKLMLMWCEANQDASINVIGFITKMAPVGVFSMIFSKLILMIRNNPGVIKNILLGIGVYVMTVIGGLAVMLFLFYPLVVKLFSHVGYVAFLRTMQPAQIFAFTTASSTGTLHKTSDQVSKFDVTDRIRSFVLSLGATVNMDGTALYQGIVTLFIVQLFGRELTFSQQLSVVLYVTLSTVGVAGVPGASFITTTILLSKLKTDMGVITENEKTIALALIYLPDRLLDMCRTAANITGDAMTAILAQVYDQKTAQK